MSFQILFHDEYLTRAEVMQRHEAQREPSRCDAKLGTCLEYLEPRKTSDASDLWLSLILYQMLCSMLYYEAAMPLNLYLFLNKASKGMHGLLLKSKSSQDHLGYQERSSPQDLSVIPNHQIDWAAAYIMLIEFDQLKGKAQTMH